MLFGCQGESIESCLEFTRKKDPCFQACLRKILAVESDHKICLAQFGAEAKGFVLGIGRNLSRGMHSDLFGPFAHQVDDFSDKIWTNAKALQNFLVFFQNIFSYEPDEIVPLGPSVEYISTRIPAGNKWLSEARYAGYKHARVNNGSCLAFPSSLRQR